MRSHRARLTLIIAIWILTMACAVTAPITLRLTPTPTPTSSPTPSATPTQTLEPTATATPGPTPVPITRVEAGDYALEIGDFDRALSEYQAAESNAPDEDTRAAALIGLGRIQYEKADYASALNYFRAAASGDADPTQQAAAFYHLGRTYLDLTRYADAAEAFKTYLELRPGVLSAYMSELYGDVLVMLRDYSGAIQAYQSARSAPRLGTTEEVDLKIASSYLNSGDLLTAIDHYTQLYETTSNDYTKAQANLLMGQAYLALDRPEEAYERFLDAVTNYPRAYDSYSALVGLVEAGIPVNELYRGLVDYFVGQYGPALAALDRYMAANPDHDGAPLHYKALTLRAMNEHWAAIAQWEHLIDHYPGDRFWTSAWEEKATTLWAYLGDYQLAAQTLINFVAAAPDDPKAPELLFQAARNLERAGSLEEAALTWEQLADEYPTSSDTFQALFLAGISRYRQENWSVAKTNFQRALLLSTEPGDQAAAYLWIGKVNQVENNLEAARLAWEQAANRDPTGYYSERARDLLANRDAFAPPHNLVLGFDLTQERLEAETWLRSTFYIPPETDLSGPGSLVNDSRFERGNEFWRLGLYEDALAEFESLRKEASLDPEQTFRLIDHFYQLGLYRPAIMAARQLLTLAGMDDAATFNAPIYFNHIRFGTYYQDLIYPAAIEKGFSPLLLFSLIRQESLFEGFVQSYAGARGLMQIMPATGQGIVTAMGWPPDYTAEDLYRPVINVRLGSYYLNQQRNYFEGDLYAALAAYNGGPGNTIIWKELAPDDPDLFLEVIRFQETRQYIKRIYEIYTIYRRLYDRSP